MAHRSHGGTEYPAHITFSKVKYKLQNLIAEVRQLREKEQYARREVGLLVQKQKNDEEEQRQKCASLYAEIAAADEVRSKLESKVKDLQIEISIMMNKQKELKGALDGLLHVRDKLTNDLKASNYDLKHDIENKDSKLVVLKEKLSRHSILFEAVEREVACVKLVVDQIHQILGNKEEEALMLKEKLDKITGYEKVFIEKIYSLENKLKDSHIELSQKDKAIADLREQLETLKNNHEHELQVEALQKIIEVKEEVIQNLSGEKQALLSRLQRLELVLAKFQETAAEKEMQTEKTHIGSLESQETAREQLFAALDSKELPIHELQEECKRHEEEKHAPESKKLELVTFIHDLTEKDVCVENHVIKSATFDMQTTEFSLLEKRQPSVSETNVEENLKEHPKESSVKIGMQALKEYVRTISHIDGILEIETNISLENKENSFRERLSGNVQPSTTGISINNTLMMQTEGLAHDGTRGSYQCSTSKESVGFAAYKKPAILQPPHDDGHMLDKQIINSTNPTSTTIHSTVPDVSNAESFKSSRDITKSNSGQVIPNKIDAILLKLDRPGFSPTATEKNDLDQNASGNCGSSSSSSSSSCLSVIASASIPIDEFSSQNNATMEKRQLLESAYQNSFQNAANQTDVTVEKRQKTANGDATDQNNLTEERKQELDAYQTVFQNATKTCNFTNHAVASDEDKEMVGSPLLPVRFDFPAVSEVKECCLSAIEGSSFTPKEKCNSNSNDAKTNIIELSQYMKNMTDDHSPTCKVSPSSEICICNEPSHGYMVKCIACAQQFHAACVVLENKILDEEALACAEFIYTCQNCKTGLNKKRRKLRCFTPKLGLGRNAP